MTPQLTNQEVSIVFSLRTRTFRSVSNNFVEKKTYSLGCSEIDSQEYWILCSKTLSNKQTHGNLGRKSINREAVLQARRGERGADPEGGCQLTSC